MKNQQQITDIAYSRLAEAEILCKHKMFDGAFYLAGYSVELMLKAKVCTLLGIPNLYDEETRDFEGIKGIGEYRRAIKTHNLHLLILLSGLKQRFDFEKAENKDLSKVNSLLFNCWNEDVRYKACGHASGEDVEKILTLLSGKNGLLAWIQNK